MGDGNTVATGYVTISSDSGSPGPNNLCSCGQTKDKRGARSAPTTTRSPTAVAYTLRAWSSSSKTYRRGDGSDPGLELEPFPKARLEVLRATEAPHAPPDHDADALTKGLAFLHAARHRRRVEHHAV